MTVQLHERQNQLATHDVARAYERRINPSFWDLVRSSKRRQEFNQAFGRMAVGLRTELNQDMLGKSLEERRSMAVAKTIEQKHQIEQITAQELATEHPTRGKIANWFANKSVLAKGVITGAGAFVSDWVTAIGAGAMLNKLGRTNTDANPELVQQSQAAAEQQLRSSINSSELNAFDATNSLKEAFDTQAEAIRKPLIDDARAMALGGVIGTLAGATLYVVGQEWARAAEYAEALEHARAAEAAA